MALVFLQEKRVSRTHAASLRRQKELLIEKMEIFDHTNHSLRELLREWRDTQVRGVWTKRKNPRRLFSLLFTDRKNHWSGLKTKTHCRGDWPTARQRTW